MRWVRMTLQVLVGSSAVVGFAGGVALAIVRAVDATSSVVTTLLPIYEQLLLTFLVTGALAIAWSLLDRPAPASEPRPEPAPAPAPPVAPSKPDLAETFRQMKTYIGLEMWDLALEKANAILEHHPESREAQAVARTHNEIRWKAEPKFVTRSAPPPPPPAGDPAKELAAMVKHVKTYMELEMWELAKQKAVAVMKHFPDTGEAAEVIGLYQQIEKKLQPVVEKKE